MACYIFIPLNNFGNGHAQVIEVIIEGSTRLSPPRHKNLYRPSIIVKSYADRERPNIGGDA